MNIYLDTNLWNELCDQRVVPEEFVDRLSQKGAHIAPGIHIFYELAKTFRSVKATAQDRAKELFVYFKRFIESDTHCVKDNMELLASEMRALQQNSQVPDIFLSREDRAKVVQELDRLVRSGLDDRAKQFLQDQDGFAIHSREQQVQHLNNRPEIKSRLALVSSAEFEAWLQKESTGKQGVGSLTVHIMRRFPEANVVEAAECASALLATPTMRFSKGLICADLYYNWRCAQRGSVPKDMLDDMYHVLNSVYCAVYATTEEKQEQYARFLLTADTKVAVYDRKTPADRWIESLC